MIAQSRYCQNTLKLGSELTGQTLDQCERLCSTKGLCERFAYGRDNTGGMKKCQLFMKGCTPASNGGYNLYYPKVKVLEVPSELKDKCTHLDIYQKT